MRKKFFWLKIHKRAAFGIQYQRKGLYSVETHCTIIGCGKAVVYLHGWGCDGSVFAPVANNLNEYCNYMIDFAGFGSSPSPPESGYTVADYVNQIAEFFKQNNLSDVVIVAHSFGCRVAIMLAATYPKLVDRMLLFAPAGIRRKSFKRWLKVRFFKLRKRFCPNKASAMGSDDYKNASPTLKNTFVKVVNQDLSSYAKKARVKTLIVAAKNDLAVPLKDAERLHRLIRNSDFSVVEGDHFALFYAPAAFAQIIRLFAEE